MRFSIASHRTAASTRLCVSGELDMSTTPWLSRAITDAVAAGSVRVTVDLAATTFCDCAGITALLACRREALARDVAFQVVNPTGICLQNLRILDLYTLLTAPPTTNANDRSPATHRRE